MTRVDKRDPAARRIVNSLGLLAPESGDQVSMSREFAKQRLARAGALLALLAVASPTQGASGVIVNDDFNGAALNELLWRVTQVRGTGAVTQTGGYLETATVAGQDLAEVEARSLVALTGDFDVVVDYQRVSQPTYWSHSTFRLESCDRLNNMNLYVSRSLVYTYIEAIESTYFVGGVQVVPPDYWTLIGDDTTGKFRISRTGSTMTSYYWRNSAWQALAAGVVFGGPVSVVLSTYIDNRSVNPGTASPAVFRWDNLSAQSQGATGCP